MSRHAKAFLTVVALVAIGCGVKPLSVTTYPTQPEVEIAVSVHTHVVRNSAWGIPSEWDVIHQYDWTLAPFKVLVSVREQRPSKVTVYGLR